MLSCIPSLRRGPISRPAFRCAGCGYPRSRRPGPRSHRCGGYCGGTGPCPVHFSHHDGAASPRTSGGESGSRRQDAARRADDGGGGTAAASASAGEPAESSCPGARHSQVDCWLQDDLSASQQNGSDASRTTTGTQILNMCSIEVHKVFAEPPLAPRRSRSQREPVRRLTPGLPFESPPRDAPRPAGPAVAHQQPPRMDTMVCFDLHLAPCNGC